MNAKEEQHYRKPRETREEWIRRMTRIANDRSGVAYGNPGSTRDKDGELRGESARMFELGVIG